MVAHRNFMRPYNVMRARARKVKPEKVVQEQPVSQTVQVPTEIMELTKYGSGAFEKAMEACVRFALKEVKKEVDKISALTMTNEQTLKAIYQYLDGVVARAEQENDNGQQG